MKMTWSLSFASTYLKGLASYAAQCLWCKMELTICTKPDIKVLQIQLTGFLDKDTAKFCKELWSLCLSAQSNPQGVPQELLEAKKLELIQEKVGVCASWKCSSLLITHADCSRKGGQRSTRSKGGGAAEREAS